MVFDARGMPRDGSASRRDGRQVLHATRGSIGGQRPTVRRTSRRARRARRLSAPTNASARPRRRTRAPRRTAKTLPTSWPVPTGRSACPVASPSNTNCPRRRPRQRCTTTAPASLQNAHTCPRRGRCASTTRTSLPGRIVRPIEMPEMSSQSGFDAAVRRSAEAICSGRATRQ